MTNRKWVTNSPRPTATVTVLMAAPQRGHGSGDAAPEAGMRAAPQFARCGGVPRVRVLAYARRACRAWLVLPRGRVRRAARAAAHRVAGGTGSAPAAAMPRRRGRPAGSAAVEPPVLDVWARVSPRATRVCALGAPRARASPPPAAARVAVPCCAAPPHAIVDGRDRAHPRRAAR
jgi:hypothetical protein